MAVQQYTYSNTVDTPCGVGSVLAELRRCSFCADARCYAELQQSASKKVQHYSRTLMRHTPLCSTVHHYSMKQVRSGTAQGIKGQPCCVKDVLQCSVNMNSMMGYCRAALQAKCKLITPQPSKPCTTPQIASPTGDSPWTIRPAQGCTYHTSKTQA